MIEKKWEEIKSTLKKEYDISEISYNTWIDPLKFYNEEDHVVTILIPSDRSHALNYIKNKYKSYFKVTISEMFNETYDISFILEKDITNESNEKNDFENDKKLVFNINHENANLNPKYIFSTFVCSFCITCCSRNSRRNL